MSTTLTEDWLRSRPGTVKRRTARHRVTAVLVAHNGAAWLSRSLAALDGSDRNPDLVTAVDTGSRDDSIELLRGASCVDRVLEADADTGFGQAVAIALGGAEDPEDDRVIDVSDGPTIDLRDSRSTLPPDAGGEDSIEWVWLLHDDMAVRPDTLDQLLRAADAHPDAAVIGPKVKGWDDPDLLVECGVTVSGSGRRETGLARGERDQGQCDDDLDVLAVGSAGMLVRRDLWDELGGFDLGFPLFRDDLEFCWRARRAGARVIVAPEAEVRHVEASARGRRDSSTATHHPLRQDRRASAFVLLSHASKWHLPLTAARLAVGSMLRAVCLVLGKAPDRARDEVAAITSALLSVRSLRTARRRLRSHDVTSEQEIRALRPSVMQSSSHWQEDLTHTVGGGNRSGTDPLRAFRRRIRTARVLILALVAPLAVVCLIATHDLWFGPGRLLGGALLPVPDTAADLWASFVSPWHAVGLGSDVPSAPYLLLVALGSLPLLGDAPTAVQILLFLGPVWAGVSAFYSARGLIFGPMRFVAAGMYALLPASIAAVDTGRLGTVAMAVLLPPTARLIALACGAADSRLGPATWSAAGRAALLLTAVFAFTPAIGVLLLLIGVVWAVARRSGSAVLRMLFMLAAPVLVLWPWSGYLLGHPTLLLFEVGAVSPSLTEPAATPLRLLALSPGGPGAPPAWLGVGILVLGAAALLPARTRRPVCGAWLVVSAALTLAVAQAGLRFPVPWSSVPQSASPGPATIVMGSALIFAIGIAVAGTRAVDRGRVTTLVLVVAMLAPASLAMWWCASAGPLLRHADPSGLSPFAAEESGDRTGSRTLVLRGAADGSVSYQLVSGTGERLGDAEVAPPIESLAAVDRAVAHLASGQGIDDLATLANSSVKYIQVRARSDRELAGNLDSVPGLRRLSTVAGQALWEVPGVRPPDAMEPNGSSRAPVLLIPLAALLVAVVVALPRAHRRANLDPTPRADDERETVEEGQGR